MTDAPQQPTRPTRVVVWNENVHETRGDETVARTLPATASTSVVADGLASCSATRSTSRRPPSPSPSTASPRSASPPPTSCSGGGTSRTTRCADEVVERVVRHVQAGMGLDRAALGHYSKPFTRLLGTTCSLRWRNDAERELVWTVAPTHPIAEGVPDPLVIPEQETYGEYFDIPTPDELIFLSTFTGGEVFRSGATWRRGLGKLFYFSPGDQEYPVYHQPEIRRVLANGVRWARPTQARRELTADIHPLGWFEQG